MIDRDLERFMAKVIKLNSGCWIWNANSDRDGYGKFKYKRKTIRSHRWIYEFYKEPLGQYLCLHTCDNPSCVNPDHLYKGDQFDNEKDKIDRNRHFFQQKTHCPKGHLYDKLNTHYINGGRKCKACQYLKNLGRKRCDYDPYSWHKRKKSKKIKLSLPIIRCLTKTKTSKQK